MFTSLLLLPLLLLAFLFLFIWDPNYFKSFLLTTTTTTAHPTTPITTTTTTTTTTITTGKPFDVTTKQRMRPQNDLFIKASSLPLTPQQSELLTAVSNGRSVFITGSAGTGKTILLARIIDLLQSTHGPKHVFVTASTGVAACAVDGQTLHSFAGVGLANADKETLLRKVQSNEYAPKRWRNAKALLIDEISMIDGYLFEKLEFIARKVRCDPYKERVWGGIQLIVSGDFFQLPPIIDPKLSAKEFAFEADCWNASFDLQIELTQVFRQSDSQLIELLQGIRRGRVDSNLLQLLNECCNRSEPDSSVTQLYPRNQDVKRVNEVRLRSLGEEIIAYTAVDTGREPWKSQLKQGIAPEELEICLGARVMLIKNINQKAGLVNGTTGTVTGFIKPENVTIVDVCQREMLPRVRFDSGKEVVIEPVTWEVTEGEIVRATRTQVPLILAWALSIHKCQGTTLNSLHTDLSRAFGCGMVYVALSRVRNLDGLYLSGFNSSKIKAHQKVFQFYQNFPSKKI